MKREFPIRTTIIIMFIILIIFIQIISKYKRNKKEINYNKSIIRHSYGNEFYNYHSGEKSNETVSTTDDNIQEVIVEGFPFNTTNGAIQETHSVCPCPVTENQTSITSCIHLPNNSIEGLPGPINSGFLVSVSSCDCVSDIQESLTTGRGLYNIIYENENYILTRDREKKQVLLECNPTNLNTITNLVGTTLGNC